ncbi:MAG: exodeoxyribonuclease VII large subunit [Patescibacteria group bacterium]
MNDDIKEQDAVSLSVTQFVEYINSIVGRRKVTVEGEVASYKINQGKWVFFTLKDEQSVVECFGLAYQVPRLEDGMQVSVFGAPRVYGKTGKFSIFVDRVEAKGEGALKRAFELTKAKLQQEGIFDAARKRALPRFPKKIGLIASRESAAYTDFMRIVHNRFGGLEIYLSHVHVQGAEAITDIVQSFDWFNAHGVKEGIDVIVLIRGGGSLEDLQAFNSESIARAVFGSTIPIVCGVGHERDETLADYAADVRAATPTHAASLVVPDRSELLATVSADAALLSRSLEHTLEWQRSRYEQSIRSMEHVLVGRITHMQRVLQGFYGHASVYHQTLLNARAKVTESVQRISAAIDYHYRSLCDRKVFLERQLNAVNPLTVLKRGYSIIKRKGIAISSIKDVKPGDQIDISFSDGDAQAKILSEQQELF